MTRPSFGRVEYLLFLLLGAGNAPGERKFAVIAFGAALVGAARLTVRSLRGARRADARGADEGGGEHPWELVLIWSGALVPLLVVLAASVVRPTFVDKYLIESLPFVTLAVAVGVDGLHPRWLAHATLAAALALNVHAVLAYYARPTKDDWRGATRWVLTAARVGDAAAFVPSYSIAPFEYYRTRHARRMRQAHAGSDTLRPQVVFPGRFGRETSELTTALAAGRLSRESNRLWVVFNHDGAAGAALRDTLAQRYRVVDDEQFRGVRVVLYEVPQSGRHR